MPVMNERQSRKFGVSFALLTGVQSSEWVAASKIVRLVENPHMQSFSLFSVWSVDPKIPLSPQVKNNNSLFEKEKGLFWKGILEALIFNKGETLKEYGTILP